MAEIRCPYCNLVSRVADGMPANCVRCGKQLPAGAEFPQNVQYAQQPVPQTEQSSAAAPQMPAEQTAAPAYPPETLKFAAKKRRDWRILNVVLFIVQTFALGFGVYLNDAGNGLFAPALAGWMLSVPLFAFLSARMRPDGAYLERPPLVRSRFVHGLIQFLIGGVSFFTAAIIYAILESAL